MEQPRFVYTTAIKKIRKLKKRKKVIQGSTSAGKTYGIIPVLIDRAAKTPKLKITIVAETVPAVKDGCVDIFKTVMQDTNRWIEDHWIGNPMEYTFSNGSRIQFKSFDTVGKAKAAGKRDILFINEGNHIPYAIADTLMVRSKETYIDFNADEEFWAHTEVMTEPNSEFLELTYLDNEALPEEILEELLVKRSKAYYNPELPEPELFAKENIKSQYWHNWWLVYGLGKIGSYTERRIYNYEIVDEIPQGIKKLPSGMDFGQSPDPTCLLDVYLDGIDLYLDLIFRENNLLPERIEGADRLCIADKLDELNFPKGWLIIGDSSGKTELQDLKKNGYNVRGVKKGPGSVAKGIKRMRGYNLKVTKRSQSVIEGLRTWSWKVDDNGKIIPEPDGHEPDELAAARYVCLAKPLW